MVTARGFRTAVRKDLTVADGDAAFDTSGEVAAIVQANTASGNFVKIWQMTVPAQQAFSWGFGSPELQRNQGYMHFMALDVGTDFEDGELRLIISDANEERKHVVTTINTTRLHTVTATTVATGTPQGIDNLYPLPLHLPYRAGQDSLLILEFKTLVAGTTVDAVDFLIPSTRYTP